MIGVRKRTNQYSDEKNKAKAKATVDTLDKKVSTPTDHCNTVDKATYEVTEKQSTGKFGKIIG